MPYQINRVAIGLDDIIGGKGWVSRPSLMSDQLACVFDSRLEYLAAQQRVIQVNLSATGTGFLSGAGTALVVPDGDWWFVRKCTQWVTAAIGAGDTLQWLPYWQPTGNGIFSCPTQGQVGTVGLQPMISWDVDTWIPPASRFGIFVQQKVGVTNYTVTTSLLLTSIHA